MKFTEKQLRAAIHEMRRRHIHSSGPWASMTTSDVDQLVLTLEHARTPPQVSAARRSAPTP